MNSGAFSPHTAYNKRYHILYQGNIACNAPLKSTILLCNCTREPICDGV